MELKNQLKKIDVCRRCGGAMLGNPLSCDRCKKRREDVKKNVQGMRDDRRSAGLCPRCATDLIGSGKGICPKCNGIPEDALGLDQVSVIEAVVMKRFDPLNEFADLYRRKKVLLMRYLGGSYRWKDSD
jgi:hypothetical protein